MEYKASTQTNVKLDNQKMILNLLIEEGPMSRADISKKMQSSKPTISKNVDDLILQNCVVEAGKADNMVGKKGTLVDINQNYKHILAMDMSKNNFRLVLANLRQEWLYYEETSLEDFIEDDSKDITVFIDAFLSLHQIDITKIAQVVIAYPGVVGHNDLFYLTNLKNKEILLNQLTPFIKKRFQLNGIVKNDINLATLAEKRFGKFSRCKNIYLISGDVGVGSGVIINHELFEGDRNAAGEIGFVLPIQHFDGHYYTLEERLGVNAIAKRFSDLAKRQQTFSDFSRGIKENNISAVKLYNEILDDLTVAITNVASVLDIKTVISIGRLFTIKDEMLEDLNLRISKMTPFETIVYQGSMDKPSLKGAVIVGIEKIVEEMIID